MSRTRKLVGVLLACLIMCVAFFGWMLGQNKVIAQTEMEIEHQVEFPIEVTSEDGTTRAAANLVLLIGGTGNGYVWAKVENTFTYPSVDVWVYIELYSSLTYQESYTTMTLEYRESTHDLNQGESIGISASTNGQQKYWQARARFKVDVADWDSKTTSTLLYDANGNCIEWN